MNEWVFKALMRRLDNTTVGQLCTVVSCPSAGRRGYCLHRPCWVGAQEMCRLFEFHSEVSLMTYVFAMSYLIPLRISCGLQSVCEIRRWNIIRRGKGPTMIDCPEYKVIYAPDV